MNKEIELTGSKPSIYVGTALAKALGDRLSDDRNLSQTLSAMSERYSEMCDRSLPTMTVAEWVAVYMIVKKWAPTPATISHLGSEVADALPRFVDDDQRFNRMALTKAAMRWNFCEKVAVVDACERLRETKGKAGWPAALKALGIIVG